MCARITNLDILEFTQTLVEFCISTHRTRKPDRGLIVTFSFQFVQPLSQQMAHNGANQCLFSEVKLFPKCKLHNFDQRTAHNAVSAHNPRHTSRCYLPKVPFEFLCRWSDVVRVTSPRSEREFLRPHWRLTPLDREWHWSCGGKGHRRRPPHQPDVAHAGHPRCHLCFKYHGFNI